MESDLLARLRASLGDRYRFEVAADGGLAILGRGGMASVYLAEDVKLGRPVAIKVLRPELVAHGTETERFLREIRIAARLNHPGILPLHDSGSSDGLLYYVMPYVGGESLRDRLQSRAPLPIDEALRITRAVAAALDYAHRGDILHRDIKPENILLHEGHAMVADFGVGRAISGALAGQGAGEVTERGLAVGTPAYMSPEQASGDRELDGRSDIYSLACVLYEMLTGKPPFAGLSARATMAKHAVEPVPAIRTLRPNVPAVIEQAVLKALAKEPAHRFATAQAFAEALVTPLSGLSQVVPGVGTPLADARAIAVLPFVNGSADLDNEYFSDGITEELINALANVEGLRVASRTSVFALKGKPQDIRAIGALLNVSTILEGTVRKAGQRLRITAQLTGISDGRTLWSGRYDRDVEDVFAVQDEIAHTIVATLRGSLLGDLADPAPKRYTRNLKAYNLYLKGRYSWNKRTPEGTQEGMSYFEQAIAEDAGFALAYTGLADSYALQADYRGAPVMEGMQKAKELALKALELDETSAEAHTSLGWVSFIYEWDFLTAEREFRRAIELDPRYATARQWYAWLLIAMGQFRESVAEGRVAIELDPASVGIRRSLGWLHLYAREPDHAIEHLRRALMMDPTSEESHRVLGLAYLQKGMYEEAIISCREALASASDGAYASAALGYVQAMMGRPDQAREVLNGLYGMAKTRYVSPVCFVMVHGALGENEPAFSWLEHALQQRRGWLVYLNVEPMLDRLRPDPRFAEFARRMRLA